MTRRTHTEVAAAAVEQEQLAIRKFAHGQALVVDQMIEKGKLSAADGSLLKDWMRGFVGSMQQGLHREDPETGR